MERENAVLDLSFQFALQIITFTEGLENIKRYNMANQLFRSGTSIGANIREAQNAESKNDFIHKIKIAAKEAEETEYWLLLCQHSENYPNCLNMIDDVIVLKKIMSKIIANSKNNSNK